MIDLNKERETVHNAINTLFDIAKVQKAEIDLLNVNVANKQAEIEQLKEKLAKVSDAIEVLFESNPLLALGELLPLQQEIKVMIEASEVSE